MKNKKRESFGAFKLQLRVSRRIGNSIVNDAEPKANPINRQGKLMYHLSIPYQPMCDLDHVVFAPKYRRRESYG